MSEEATTKIGVNNELMRERKRWGFFGIPWTFTKYILTEKKIIIDYEDKPETVAITVFNTGEHIAPEDMPEIWDSFYRADKSHERSENRYGLGLSIVKSIMTNHRCAYTAENTAGGVKFSFEVAKTPEYYVQGKA